MPKKEPPNEKRFSLKPLTTRQALEKALKGKKSKTKKPRREPGPDCLRDQ
jgi:hypothetical protein